MTRRKRVDATSVIAGIIVAFGMALLFSGLLGINLLIAGGNVQCMFSSDPALCAQVAEVGR